MSTITHPITTVEPAAPAVTTASVRVIPLDGAAARAAWGRYVDASPAGTLFHHPRWSDAVVTTFGHRPRHLAAYRDDELVGVLPLVEVRSWVAGRLLISVPYGNGGGILADDADACAALAQAARELADTLGARALDLRGAAANAPGIPALPGYLGFARDLPDDPEKVAAMIPRKARAAGRYARERHGVVVRHDEDDLQLVWQLYCRSMRRLGSLNYPLALFRTLADSHGPDFWISVAQLGGRPLCGVLTLVHRDCVYPYVIGVDERVPVDGATNLLYHAIMERAVERGLRRYDFGRSRADNRGSVSFKKNQGFEPTELGYQRYVPAGRSAPDFKPSNPKFAWARRLWPRLPLPVTRTAGVVLSKALPG
jgi:FemAB-related protein (PEP-CTERM system-associated)